MDPADPDAVSHALQRIQTPTRIVPLAVKRSAHSHAHAHAPPLVHRPNGRTCTSGAALAGGTRRVKRQRSSLAGRSSASRTVAAQGSWLRSTAWAEGVSCVLSFCRLWVASNR